MKIKILKVVLFLYGLSLIIACGTKKEGAVPTMVDVEQIKKEIQAKEDGFAEVFNTRQLKSIGYYADDAISFSQNKEPLVGKEAIIEYFIVNLDSIPVSHKISFKTNEIFVSDNGFRVVEIGYFVMVDSINNDTINSGNYMSMFEKRDGKYVCVRDMSVSDLSLD